MKKTKAERFLEALGEIDEKYIEEAREKTMKKKFNFKPIIAVAACAAFALAAIPVAKHFANNDLVDGGTTAGTVAPAPGDEVNFTVYESGVHGGYDIGTHKIELTLDGDSDVYVDEGKIGKYETVYLNGQNWTAIYKENWEKTDYRETRYTYDGISNGKAVSFTINSVTGKCENFAFKNTELIDRSERLPMEKLYEIANKIFLSGGFTEDPENYQLSAEGDNGKAGYWFKFSRFVEGIETSEYVMIALTNKGDFRWFSGNRIGEMKDIDVSGFDMDKLYDAIEVKLKKIYGDAYVGFERDGAILTKLTNGSYVFEYGRDVDVTNDNGELTKDRSILTITINK